jgi:GT2 family glycosyltransferase
MRSCQLASEFMTAGQLSIVIPSHNESAHLPCTLDTLLSTSPPGSEIIVVDDASTDDTSLIARRFPDVHFIRNETRRGAATARNIGAAQAHGEIVIFSDAHVEPSPGWSAPLVDALSGDQSVGVAGPTVSTFDRSRRGYGFTWTQPTLAVHWLRSRPATSGCVPFVCGCFLAIRRSLFQCMGGFDDGLAMWGCEDAELCLRVWRFGYTCLIVPESEIAHLFRSTFPYSVSASHTLHNKLRLAAIHFGVHAFFLVAEQYREHADFAAACEQLAAGDAQRRRRDVSLRSVRDDREFFEVFGMDAFLAGPPHASVRL